MEEEGFREVVTLECLIREFQIRKIVMPSFDPDRPVPLTAGQKRKAEDTDQVWPLTQFYSVDFFLFPFCENSLICLEGKSMTPHRGNTNIFCSSQDTVRCAALGPRRSQDTVNNN